MRVLCIDAKEPGIPVKEGETYTVKSQFVGNQVDTEAPREGMEKTPGYMLEGVAGYFRADRFKIVEA